MIANSAGTMFRDTSVMFIWDEYSRQYGCYYEVNEMGGNGVWAALMGMESGASDDST